MVRLRTRQPLSEAEVPRLSPTGLNDPEGWACHFPHTGCRWIDQTWHFDGVWFPMVDPEMLVGLAGQ